MERGDVLCAEPAGGRRRGMTRDEFLDRFRSKAAATDRIRGDYDLNPEMEPPEKLRDAAVLVGLVERDDGLSVLLTQRTAHLNAHAGQISFPGGRIEADDPTPIDAALREAEEEIGLNPRHVEVVGRLDLYRTRTGFRITPIVALVRPPFDLTLQAEEVAEAFETPLDFFLADNMPKKHGRVVFGHQRWFYAFPWRDRYIWGATAGMLVNLRDALAP